MRPISALLALLALLALPPAPRAKEEPPAFKVVRPSGEAHELLPKTCSVCHKDSPYQFVVVASTTREGLDRALQLLSAPELGTVAAKPSNPHTTIACLFCHMEQPAAGADPVAMRFRTLTGADVAVAEVTRLCQMCHPEGDEGHPKVLGEGKTAVALFEAGLPVSANTVVCTTCHDMHGTEVGPADLRLAYLMFARKSPLSYVHGNRSGCLACHPKAGLGSLNPHQQIDEKGKLVTSTCTFCHRSAPDPEDIYAAYSGDEDLNFLHSPVELCAGCHETFAHPTGVNHLVEMSDQRRKQLNEYEQRHRLSLPLDGAHRIVCTTCHNPHAKGVLADEAALGAGEKHMWRVPSYAELCTPCHTRYD